MTPRTLRRKLQEKKKHKQYRKCPNCGRGLTLRLEDNGIVAGLPYYQLYKECVIRPRIGGCGYKSELFVWRRGSPIKVIHVSTSV